MMNVRIVTLGIILFINVFNAKSQKISTGTKLQIKQIQKLNNSSNMMGMDMQTVMNGTSDVVVEIKSVKDSTIVLTAKTVHLSGSVSLMGQESAYDSNDSTTMKSPMAAPFLADLNKPKEFVFVNGNLISENKNKTNDPVINTGLQLNLSELIGQLFISSVFKNKSEGYKWTSEEKSNGDSMKSISIYSVSKSTEKITEITSTTTQSIKGTNTMMGMDVTQNLTGSRTSVLTYDRVTGILSSISQNIEMKGTAEAMGTSIPVNTKGTITTTVK